jgi:Protein tyrosine and serine/threonine kinase
MISESKQYDDHAKCKFESESCITYKTDYPSDRVFRYGEYYELTASTGTYLLYLVDSKNLNAKDNLLVDLDLGDSNNIVTAIDKLSINEINFVIPYYEYCTLSKFIELNLINTEEEALEYFRQICYGFKTLWDKHYAHRNLTQNCILVRTKKTSIVNYCLDVLTFGKLTKIENDEQNSKYLYSLGKLLLQLLTTRNYYKDNFKVLKHQGLKAFITHLKFKGQITELSDITKSVLSFCFSKRFCLQKKFDELFELLNIAGLYTDNRPIMYRISKKWRTKTIILIVAIAAVVVIFAGFRIIKCIHAKDHTIASLNNIISQEQEECDKIMENDIQQMQNNILLIQTQCKEEVIKTIQQKRTEVQIECTENITKEVQQVKNDMQDELTLCMKDVNNTKKGMEQIRAEYEAKIAKLNEALTEKDALISSLNKSNAKCKNEGWGCILL